MKEAIFLTLGLGLFSAAPLLAQTPEITPPRVPQFSTNYLDRSVSPATNFYLFADGSWVKENPVPADKSRWGSFQELNERNTFLIHEILEAAAANTDAPAGTPVREVGDFYASAMDTNRIEQLRFQPIQSDLDRVAALTSKADLLSCIAEYQREGNGLLFRDGVGPDDKDSSIYSFSLGQGGLSLPDRDYYLKDSFASLRQAYAEHITKMFVLLGETATQAAADASTVTNLETELAQVSRSRVDMRDPDKNYNKFTVAALATRNPGLNWPAYIVDRGVPDISTVVVGQPEFFDGLETLLAAHSLAEWQTYLRWHILHAAAGSLHQEVEQENFNFFSKTLSGQPQQEPRWKRAGRSVDGTLGEALGQLYVEKYFPPAARDRMAALVDNLKGVYRDHLVKVDWMTEPTRAKALEKFGRFTQKIGYPNKFRDYSSIRIDRGDYVGNQRRAAAFEEHRQTVRVGKTVDRTEWGMTPPTINAYYSPSMNEIVFPAGILQPPFFDPNMDEAVNYGAIGVVIGHEITHGYDDQGRKFDAEGNLHNWWSPDDIKQFEARTQKVVDEYNAFEVRPGLHVNGKLTLGENLADIGGISIAYDALERFLAKNPDQRKLIDGFTPEQRFFISFAQIWRTNARDAEVRRLIVSV